MWRHRGYQFQTGNVEPNKSHSKKINHNETNVYKEIHPVLFTLGIFGMRFYKSCIHCCYKSHTCEIIWNIYSVFVSLLLGTYNCRWIGVFHNPSTDLQLIFNVLTTVWAVQCLVHFVVFSLESFISSKLHTYMWPSTGLSYFAVCCVTSVFNIQMKTHNWYGLLTSIRTVGLHTGNVCDGWDRCSLPLCYLVGNTSDNVFHMCLYFAWIWYNQWRICEVVKKRFGMFI